MCVWGGGGLLHTDNMLTVAGFNNCKQATFTGGGLTAPANTEVHIRAMTAWRNLEKIGHDTDEGKVTRVHTFGPRKPLLH